MAKKRVAKKKSSRSPTQIVRDRAIREEFQQARPSLKSLTASGAYTPPIKQGEYLVLMQLAARMKAAREQQRLSLTEVASRSGIDKAALSRLENGLADNPTVSTLTKVARSLGKRIRIELDDDMSVRVK